MVAMFYGLDENQGQVGAQHGTDWSVVTNTNTNTFLPLLPPSLTLQHHQRTELSHSRSQSSATSGGQIIEEIKVILVRSNLLTFLALCQDTAPPSFSLVTLESSWSSGPSLCSSLPQVVDNYVISAGQSNRWWLACPTLRLQNYTIGLHMTQTPPDAAFLAFSKVAS